MRTKKYLSKIAILAFPFVLAGCGSTSVQPQPAKEENKPAIEERKELQTEKDEYHKSVGSLTVSKDTFESDKAEILRTIESLKTIMSDFDYQSWLLYVDNESKIYWSKTANLKKAQGKLPIKGLQLRTLQDYFTYVFVPSRAGRNITTIRYESENYVKAVQVTSLDSSETEEKYTVYYYFNKIDGHWQLHLPEIDS